MSLEMVPEPSSVGRRTSPLAQRRVKSYEDTVQGEPPDYDRNRITQFIRQPFPTKPTVDELRRTTSAVVTAAVGACPRPTFSYNDTGSFEEVDEEKVVAMIDCVSPPIPWCCSFDDRQLTIRSCIVSAEEA